MRLLIFLTIVVAIALLWRLRSYRRRVRTEKLFTTPLDSSWVSILESQVTIYSTLPQTLRDELHGHINVFLDGKQFIGRDGVEITDEIRVVVAGNACLLLLQGNGRRFTGFSSILIYPNVYVAHGVEHDGVVATQKSSKRAGESWVKGPVVLSWASTHSGSVNAEDGHNVVIHEFAHKLDEQSGHMNGLPVLKNNSAYKVWGKILSEEFSELQKRASRGKNKVLDEYGTVSPAEFFAVASESFFEKPTQMKKRLPELYEQLQSFYSIDPASWV